MFSEKPSKSKWSKRASMYNLPSFQVFNRSQNNKNKNKKERIKFNKIIKLVGFPLWELKNWHMGQNFQQQQNQGKVKTERKRKRGYFASINIGKNSTPTAIGEAELSNGGSKKNKLRSRRSYHVRCNSIKQIHPKGRNGKNPKKRTNRRFSLPPARMKLRLQPQGER